jgi:hypothetical protein
VGGRAATKGGGGASAPAKAARKKRRLSPEGRAPIIAVTKNAVGGGEDGQGSYEDAGGQTGREARCTKQRD